MNPLGFDVSSRHITLSEEDLNRSFPGNPGGSLAERMAHTILQSILETKPSLVLDLHNDWTRTIPYIVLDALGENPTAAEQRMRDKLFQLANSTQFPIVEEPNPLRRSLSHTLVQAGIPALTFELGESQVVNEANVAMGVAAVWEILAGQGMVEADANLAPNGEAALLRYSSHPLCSTCGILRFLCEPGQKVRKGQVIARVHDAFGRILETLRVEADALVLGVADSSATFPGAPAVALGLYPE
jgi:predicted deacylase